MRQIVLVAHNVRSAHNVGSILRTADGFGVEKVYLTGYTPYPKQFNDKRLPHEAKKVHNRIAKTSLGAESIIVNEHFDSIEPVLELLHKDRFLICALEQARNSVSLPKFQPSNKVAVIVGREVEGIEEEILKKVDTVLEIPMFGNKESFNVSTAVGIALYHIRFA